MRPVRLEDAKRIIEIYNYYIEETVITFEEEALTVEMMEERIQNITQDNPWFVEEVDGKVVGYAYATTFKARSAYRYTVETTVYIDSNYRGKGLGTSLYKALLASLKEKGKHVAIGCITIPNEKSVALHERLGFIQVGHFKKVGFKMGEWRDIGYWQCNL